MTGRGLFLGFLLGAMLITGPVAAQSTQPPRYALVIANANYPDDNTVLPTSIKDAAAIAAELKRNGFEVDTGQNLTRLGMQSAIDNFKAKIKPGSVALFFYSGIGIQATRQNYIIPVNAQIWAENDVKRDGIRLDTILNDFETLGARVKLVILDASRKNPFERRFRRMSIGLAADSLPGTLMISAASPGQVVQEGTGENSVFVSELLKELRSPNASAETMFGRARLGVSSATNGEQVPLVSNSLSEEFRFSRSTTYSSSSAPAPAPKVPEVTPPPPPPAQKQASAPVNPPPLPPAVPQVAPPPPPPSAAVDADLKARQDCAAAQQTATRKGWQDFLDAHPSGFCSDTARDQIARLDAAAAKVESPPQAPRPPAVTNAKDDRAIADFTVRIDKNPRDADAYYQRGQLYAKRGDNDRALRDFDQAVQLNPNDAEAWNNRCWVRALTGQLQAALEDCNRSLSIQPNFADAFDSRGFIRLKMNDSSSAIADYNSALRGNPEQASALYGRGKAKLKMGDTAGGNADIAAAKSIKADIAEEFAGYGVQ